MRVNPGAGPPMEAVFCDIMLLNCAICMSDGMEGLVRVRRSAHASPNCRYVAICSTRETEETSLDFSRKIYSNKTWEVGE